MHNNVSNLGMSFNLMKNYISYVFMSTKIQNEITFHLFQKEQILGCYNCTPLKMNLILEIRTMLTQRATGMFSLGPLLFPK